MSRKIETEINKKEENKRRKIISNSLWSTNERISKESIEIICHDYNENEIYTTYPGRRSYGGFNPHLERMNGNQSQSSNNNNNNNNNNTSRNSSRSSSENHLNSNSNNKNRSKGNREIEREENYDLLKGSNKVIYLFHFN